MRAFDIAAECGGACACATCHVYVTDGWFEKLPPRSDAEVDMLDMALAVETEFAVVLPDHLCAGTGWNSGHHRAGIAGKYYRFTIIDSHANDDAPPAPCQKYAVSPPSKLARLSRVMSVLSLTGMIVIPALVTAIFLHPDTKQFLMLRKAISHTI